MRIQQNIRKTCQCGCLALPGMGNEGPADTSSRGQVTKKGLSWKGAQRTFCSNPFHQPRLLQTLQRMEQLPWGGSEPGQVKGNFCLFKLHLSSCLPPRFTPCGLMDPSRSSAPVCLQALKCRVGSWECKAGISLISPGGKSMGSSVWRAN